MVAAKPAVTLAFADCGVGGVVGVVGMLVTCSLTCSANCSGVANFLPQFAQSHVRCGIFSSVSEVKLALVDPRPGAAAAGCSVGAVVAPKPGKSAFIPAVRPRVA